MTSNTEIEKSEYQIMDARDETQILSELQGHYMEEFVYSFRLKNGTPVIGLSWAGIKEIAYRMKGIQIEDCKIEDKADYWLVTCKALDIERRSSRFGVATQSKTMKHKDGSVEPDDFALQKAMSKAQRNAIRGLIPEVTAKQYLNQFMNERSEDRREQPRVYEAKPVQAPQKPVVKDPDAVELPFKVRLLNAIRPDIANLIEVVHEDETVLVIKPMQHLEPKDFAETCSTIEKGFNGKWLKPEGVWEIPVPKA